MNKPIVYTLENISEIAQKIVRMVRPGMVVAITGSLGAGKTTLVQEILRQLGVSGPVQSPTFTYVSVYKIVPHPLDTILRITQGERETIISACESSNIMQSAAHPECHTKLQRSVVYRGGAATIIYHFDLYRLTSTEQFLEMGFGEYLYEPEAIAFVEWPEIIEPLLQGPTLKIVIEYEGNNQRRIELF